MPGASGDGGACVLAWRVQAYMCRYQYYMQMFVDANDHAATVPSHLRNLDVLDDDNDQPGQQAWPVRGDKGRIHHCGVVLEPLGVAVLVQPQVCCPGPCLDANSMTHQMRQMTRRRLINQCHGASSRTYQTRLASPTLLTVARHACRNDQ